MLDSGQIDVAVGGPPTHADGRILHRTVLTDDFVTLVAQDNPAARHALTMECYLQLRHVLVSQEGELHGHIDHALAQQGQQRDLAMTLLHMFAVPAIIARIHRLRRC